jgi:hypothetical protein
MHNYASTNQDQLPPAAVCGTDGKPLLSWRVLILPYIKQQELFDVQCDDGKPLGSDW